MIARLLSLCLLPLVSTATAQDSTSSSVLNDEISIVEAFYQLTLDQLNRIDAAIADPTFPLERKSSILEMRVRNAVPQVLISLVGDKNKNPPLQLAAKWEAVRRAADCELVRTGRDNFLLRDDQVEPFLRYAAKLTGTEVPPFWQKVLKNAKFQSNGEFDLFAAWEIQAENSVDLGYAKSQLVGNKLFVDNGSVQVSIQVEELTPVVESVNLLELDGRKIIVYVDYVDRTIHMVDPDKHEENRISVLNVATDWTFLKSPLFEVFPTVTADRKNIIVFYANPACVGIACICLESWAVVWNGACIF